MSGDAAAEVTSSESKPSEAATAEAKSVETGDSVKADDKVVEAKVETKPEDVQA